MHDTIFEGKPSVMTKLARNRIGDYVRIPQENIDIRKQRGRYHPKLKVDDMREELAKYHVVLRWINKTNFKNKAMPTYSSEINSIERCWSQGKRYTGLIAAIT